MELDLGRPDSAQAVFDEVIRRYPGNVALRGQGALVAYAAGDRARARRSFDSLVTGSGEGLDGLNLRYDASLALVEGRLGRAGELLRRAGGGAQAALRDSLTLITARTWFTNTNAGAAARIDAAVAKHPLSTMALQDRPYLEVATAYARVGKPDRARAVLAARRAAVTDTALLRLQNADLHTALGEIALAEGQAERALAEFRQGDVAYDGKPAGYCTVCLPLRLARAYDVGGMADSAIAAYERFIATPYSERLADADPLNLALSHERLGQLYEERGDRAKAIAHYQQFVELWKDADAALQPRVAEVKRRLARLSTGERR